MNVDKGSLLLNFLIPNLKNNPSVPKGINLDFNFIKNKILHKTNLLKDYTKVELKNIFGKNNLIVAIRIKKLNSKEVDISSGETIKKISRDTLVINDPKEINLLEENVNSLQIKEKFYSFDFVFNKDSSQEEIYLNSSKLLLEEVLEGYNATIFAYGTTGSGKTYTMVGNGENPGIMIRSVSDLFSMIEAKKNRIFVVKITYIEVYNENILDLISGKNNLELREDPKKGTQVIGVNEVTVYSADDVFKLLMYKIKLFF